MSEKKEDNEWMKEPTKTHMVRYGCFHVWQNKWIVWKKKTINVRVNYALESVSFLLFGVFDIPVNAYVAGIWTHKSSCFVPIVDPAWRLS